MGHEGRTADASAIQIYLKSAGKNKSVQCELQISLHVRGAFKMATQLNAFVEDDV